MTFNRIVDARIDARNPRTAQRPLPAGRITQAASWAMLAISTLTFGMACLGFRWFFGNTWPVLLSGPVLIYLCGYSFAKRFTQWSHFYLGAAIATSPVAAWLAVDPGSVGRSALILFGTVTCWIAGFDIIYACQDIEVDRREGLHSLPSRMGPATALWVSRTSHLLVVVGLVFLGAVEHFGALYASGVVIVSILLFVEQSLVRPGDYSRVNLAFFTVNGIVSILLAATAIAEVIMQRTDVVGAS